MLQMTAVLAGPYTFLAVSAAEQNHVLHGEELEQKTKVNKSLSHSSVKESRLNSSQ